MELVEVDVVGAEPSQARLEGARTNVRRRPVLGPLALRSARWRPSPARSRTWSRAGPVACGAEQRPADDLLVGALAVDVAGVEEGDPELERLARAAARPRRSETSPHQFEPSAQVPKPISEHLEVGVAERRVLTRAESRSRRRIGSHWMPAPSTACRRSTRASSSAPQGWPYLLAPFIPIAIVLEVANASDVLVFFTSALGIIPTAALMGRATEELAARSGPGIGGLMNVTFGNAPELIIALFALGHGLARGGQGVADRLDHRQHPAGPRRLDAGWRAGTRRARRFNKTAASAQTSMLLLAAVALVMPAVFQLVDGGGLPAVGRRARHVRLDDRDLCLRSSPVC